MPVYSSAFFTSLFNSSRTVCWLLASDRAFHSPVSAIGIRVELYVQNHSILPDMRNSTSCSWTFFAALLMWRYRGRPYASPADSSHTLVIILRWPVRLWIELCIFKSMCIKIRVLDCCGHKNNSPDISHYIYSGLTTSHTLGLNRTL